MNNMSTLIKFPVASFRKISSPTDDKIGKTYIAVVNVKDLPKELDDWRALNPRDPKLSSGVSKKILETLQDQPDLFLLKNRGLTILVEKVEFDNQSNLLKIEMVDNSKHGLLDGGHTFRVIRSFIDALEPDELTDVSAMVKLEILEGVQDRNDVIGIVEARNTSTQVKEQGIEDLMGTFDVIKEVLKGKPYENRIAYKEYELLEDGSKKDIDIKEILSYLVCFDVESFDKSKHPIKAYSTKAILVDHFSSRKKEMEKYVQLLPEILELRDVIYLELPDAYNKSANDEAGGKFGKLTGVTDTSSKKKMGDVVLEFTGKKSHYRIPSGFIYPVLASFRNLVGIDTKNGKCYCYWKTDPIKFFCDLKYDLASRVGGQAKELRNPNKLGKDVATWQSCYDAVALEVLRRHLG
jgi:hypothetical protein